MCAIQPPLCSMLLAASVPWFPAPITPSTAEDTAVGGDWFGRAGPDRFGALVVMTSGHGVEAVASCRNYVRRYACRSRRVRSSRFIAVDRFHKTGTLDRNRPPCVSALA